LLRPKQQFRLRSQPEAAFLEDGESFGSLGGLDRFTPASSRSSVLESAATRVDQSAVHSSEPQTAVSRSGLSADDHVASSADSDVTSPDELEYEYVDEEEEVEEEEEQSADVVVSSSGINSKQFGSVPAGTATAGTTTAGQGDSGDTGGRISQQEVNIFMTPSLG
jgi:hypothetical protein